MSRRSYSPLLQRSRYHHLRATVPELQIQGRDANGSGREFSPGLAIRRRCSFGTADQPIWFQNVTHLIGPFVRRLLQEFANATLRTLCLCYKDISASEFEAWSRKHREAQLVTSDRDAALDRVYEEIEKNLMASGGIELD